MRVGDRLAPRTAFVAATLLVAAVVGMLQLTTMKHHFDAHVAKHRMLHNLQETTSLRLRFDIKRSAMYVHGSAKFDVYANAVLDADGKLSYEGTAKFHSNGAKHKYLLVDGIAYYAVKRKEDGAPVKTVSCLPATDIPPVPEILSAINDAVVTTDAATLALAACPRTEKLFVVSFAGDRFLLCSSLPSGERGFKIFGEDLDIEFTYLPDRVDISTPTLTDGTIDTCSRYPGSTTAIVASTKRLFFGAATASVNAVVFGKAAQLKVAPSWWRRSGSTCKSVKRACVFIRGYGSDDDQGLRDTSKYFNGIQNYAPCCKSVKFAVMNTMTRGWNDKVLQQRTCDLILQASGSSSNSTNSTIEGTIVVAHSMGNLMVGGAIANGVCRLGASSTWVALSGPMSGSMGANAAQDACEKKSNLLYNWGVKLFVGCPANSATRALSYQGNNSYVSPTLNEQFAAAQQAFRDNVGAAMCSDHFSGLLSMYQGGFIALGRAIPHKSLMNDGVVEFASCRGGLPEAKFAESHDSKFYVTRLNHYDTTFRYGDSLFSKRKKPVKWFENLF